MCVTLILFGSIASFLTSAKFILFGILGLGFVIFVHELGHFIVAKMCGVKCEKFYVGFDVPIKIGPWRLPAAIFRKTVGETEYGIGVIPLGGYVKMLGQDDNPANSAKEAQRIRLAREGNAGELDDEEIQIDPRSYPAKPVWQRLMIISAGVVMNLIFAVIFGVVAYRMGVSYTPCVIGSTTPGLSGWRVGLQPGDQILQIGRDGKHSENLRFLKDMVVEVVMTGAGNEVDLRVRRYGKSQEEWIPVRLTKVKKEPDRPFIGIGSIPSNTIGAVMKEEFTQIPAAVGQSDLQVDDEVIAVNGTTIKDHVQITRMMATSVEKPLTFRIRRSDTEKKTSRELDVTVQPNKMRWLGLGMKIGPIVAVQTGSPAEAAGFQLDDVLVSINGEPIGNALTVAPRLSRLANQAVEIVVKRKGEDITLRPTLREPTMLHTIPSYLSSNLAAEALGIAYPALNEVTSVAPDSPADRAGIHVGDVVTTVEFIPSSEQNAKLENGIPEPLDLKEYNDDWPAAQYRIQVSLPDTKVKLTLDRNGKETTAEMLPVQSEEFFVEDRGIRFLAKTQIHKVDNLKEALALGCRETKEGLTQVVFILHKLLTGQFSPKNLGGPLSIAVMAGSEASAGFARLLTFLTMLSTNLAVLNFLPIPVLDGGHVMFLLWEGIFRRPLDERIAFALTIIGFCFILGLMVFVFGMDVWRLANWFS